MLEKRDVQEEVITDGDTEVCADTELEVEEAHYKDKLKSLREKLKICEEEKRVHHDSLQRARADFLNSKRRLEEQLARDKERATDKLITELLTLADSFTMARSDKDWDSLDAKWKNGIEAIETKLTSILKSTNVTPIDPRGEPFNPAEHEAVSNAAVTSESEVDRVVTVLQKGYKRGSDIIRPARVVVGTKQ